MERARIKAPMNPCYICVDVESAGPHPGGYSLLSIGAATVTQPRKSFYVELKPINDQQTGEAESIHGMSLEELAQKGVPPQQAMQGFADWLAEVSGDDEPVFVAFNAPFDWMFVADYFHTYLGHNPFGHRALDIKALFMGLHGVRWQDTSYQMIANHYGLHDSLPHNALQDAEQEAEMLTAMLEELKEKSHEQ